MTKQQKLEHLERAEQWLAGVIELQLLKPGASNTTEDYLYNAVQHLRAVVLGLVEEQTGRE